MKAISARARDGRLDALKGFAILCVVTYHALGQYFTFSTTTGVVYYPWVVYARAFLFSFMLPLFAFLSGYVLGRPGGLRPDYFRRRTLGLLVPYVAWETLYGPTKHPEMFDSVRALLGFYVRIFLNPHFEGRMWYLYVLWLALMVLGLARLGGDRTWVIAASILLVFVLGSFGQFNWLRWIYIYVCGGLLFRRYEPSLLPGLERAGVAGAIAFIPLWLMAEPETVASARLASMAPTGWAFILGRALLVMVPIVIGACAVVAIVAASYHLPDSAKSPLAFLGTLSLGIYVTHFPFVEMWKGMPAWFLPVNVALATLIAVGWTLVLGSFRPTATLLLGEPWVRRPREVGDVQTETL